MIRSFGLEEEGQALILIAAGFAMLMAAVAFSVDWGYTYIQHRALSNASQAAALAAGRTLATNATWTGTGFGFPGATEEDVYAVACTYALKNLGGQVTSTTYTFSVEFWQWSSSGQTLLGTKSSTAAFTSSSTTCNKPSSSTTVPVIAANSSIDARVVASASYRSLFAGVMSIGTDNSVATARSRVGGTGGVQFTDTWGNGTPWATVSHYDPSALQTGMCTSPCDPSSVTPVTFWTSCSNCPYGQFKGLVDFSRLSTEQNATGLQLLTNWDQRGSQYASPATSFKTNGAGGNCTQTGVPSGSWDTSGNDNNDKLCSIPNWTYFGFGGYYGLGTQALSTDWSSTTVLNNGPTGITRNGCADFGFTTPCREAPTDPGSRPSICPVPASLSYVTAPSCTNHRLGDWVETNTSGTVGANMASALCAVFASASSSAWLTTNQFSTRTTPTGNSACNGNAGYTSGTYGRALVVAAYLWDCGETYNKNHAVGNRWDLITGSAGDCADVSSWTGNPTPDRVHLFTVVPFTFYEGLIQSTSIQGFWGGGFASSDICPLGNCALNQLSNTTWLVGD